MGISAWMTDGRGSGYLGTDCCNCWHRCKTKFLPIWKCITKKEKTPRTHTGGHLGEWNWEWECCQGTMLGILSRIKAISGCLPLNGRRQVAGGTTGLARKRHGYFLSCCSKIGEKPWPLQLSLRSLIEKPQTLQLVEFKV